MDIASIVGMLLGVVMFVFGVLSNGGVASLHSMWDTASFIITIGGSIAGTLASFKLADFINGIKSIKLIFKDEFRIRQLSSTRLSHCRILREKKDFWHWKKQQTGLKMIF